MPSDLPFELADGGTIFLDEIGEVPLEIMERSVILCSGEWLVIDPHVLRGTLNVEALDSSLIEQATNLKTDSDAEAFANSSDAILELPQALEAVEKSHILRVLRQTNWRIEGDGGAAQILDLHPNTLRSRMKKLGLVRPVNL